jgi:uncharacterized SAM-binding protein YcdF (DUF218 family)
MKGIIVVLGSPNSDSGELGEIAINRLNKARGIYLKNPGFFKIICTGGFGPHFNTTPLPHAYYAAKYLRKKGVPDEDILEGIISRNTIEDAKKAKPVIEFYQPERLVLVTSDFHMQRAAILFEKYIKGRRLFFEAAPSTLSKESQQKLQEHEEKAIKKLNL